MYVARDVSTYINNLGNYSSNSGRFCLCKPVPPKTSRWADGAGGSGIAGHGGLLRAHEGLDTGAPEELTGELLRVHEGLGQGFCFLDHIPIGTLAAARSANMNKNPS